MNLEIFSVYDSKVEAYLQPFFMRAKGEAIRAFTETANDPQTKICQYPADYTLFHIGTYDDRSGKIITLDAFENLGNGVAFKKIATPTVNEIRNAFGVQEILTNNHPELDPVNPKKLKVMGSKPAKRRKN